MFTKFLVSLVASLPLLMLLAADAKAQNMDPRIRYTTGAVVRTGWEKQLVEGDKNLKNYYWGAMVDYSQAYKKVALPVRQDLEDFRNKQAAERPSGGVYVKPVHLPLPTRQFSPIVRNIETNGRLTHSDVSAKLARPQTSTGTAVSAKLTKPKVSVPQIATYSDLPQTESYVPRGQMATGEVRGRLLR
jgi:hypothetical protein